MATPLDELHKLVLRPNRTEIECGNLLAAHFASVLLPTEETVTYVNRELTAQTGRIDLVVIGKKTQTDGLEENVAYVWELKAPQIGVFEIAAGGRACPTMDFFWQRISCCIITQISREVICFGKSGGSFDPNKCTSEAS